MYPVNGFGMMPVMFYIVPLLMCTILIISLVRTLKEWHHNEQSPRLTVPVKVVAKRTAYRRAVNNTHTFHRRAQNYYVTFEVESGDRMELELSGPEYGMITEGDTGRLTFQGKRFLSFERTR